MTLASDRLSWTAYGIAAGAFALLTWIEMRRPLRRVEHRKARRVGRNVASFALAAVPALLQAVALVPAMAWLERERIGLLHLLRGPAWLEALAGVLLLDLTLWLWHRWNHVVPFLWRFHLVHHVDLELDASTALRFHFGEMALSVPYRFAQVAAFGISPSILTIWTVCTLLSILFHHSNLRLPIAFERKLVRLVVTPRMHGIHHSTVRAERDSNYASLLSAWDRLFGTLRLSVPQAAVRIGVPPWLADEQVTLGRITALPFGPLDRAERAEGLGPGREVGDRRILAE